MAKRHENDHLDHCHTRRAVLAAITSAAVSALLAACGGASATETPLPAPTNRAGASPSASSGQSATTLSATVPPTALPATSLVAASPTPAMTAIPAAVRTVTPPTVANAGGGLPPRLVNACDLVTKADYEAVMGEPAGDPKQEQKPDLPYRNFVRSSCTYTPASQQTMKLTIIAVVQLDAGNATGASPLAPKSIAEYWETRKRSWATLNLKTAPVPEIGPDVYLVDDSLHDTVYLFRNDLVLSVVAVVSGNSPEAGIEASTKAAKALAAKAASRL